MIRIAFKNGKTELKVVSSNTTLELLTVLENIGIKPLNKYLVKTNEKMILHANLNDFEGKPISQEKAQEVLKVIG